MKTRIVATVLLATLIAGTAYAGGIFNSKRECEDAVLAGTAEFYTPRYLGNKSKGTADVVAPLEATACVLMDTVAGRKWVAQKEGTEFWFRKKSDGTLEIIPYSLKACGNRVYSISYPSAPPSKAKEEKKPEPEKKVLVAPHPKAEAGFDPSSCGEGSEAVWDKEAKKYECRAIASTPAPAVAVAQPEYQLGSACNLSDGAHGIVTYIYPNGNLRCSEVVLVPVPSKGKAIAQYVVCTTAGVAVGYYHGGTYSAISGGVGGAGGTYVGRELWGENGGWLGCATGPAAGLIKWPDARRHRGTSVTATGPSGGGAGIGETVVGGGGGLN